MSDKTESIAANLRGERAKLHASQREVAEMVGANPSTLSNWEISGCIGFEDAWKLADLYGVSLDALAGRSR